MIQWSQEADAWRVAVPGSHASYNMEGACYELLFITTEAVLSLVMGPKHTVAFVQMYWYPINCIWNHPQAHSPCHDSRPHKFEKDLLQLQPWVYLDITFAICYDYHQL